MEITCESGGAKAPTSSMALKGYKSDMKVLAQMRFGV